MVFFTQTQELRLAGKVSIVGLSEAPSCLFNNDFVIICVLVFKDIHKFAISALRFGS